MGLEAILFIVGAILLVLWIWGATLRETRRRAIRRRSLHQDANGIWQWTEADGEVRRSPDRPDQPGGAWDDEIDRSV